MPKRPLAILAAFLTLPASAQTPTDAEASVLQRVIDILCVEVVESSNGCETAILLTSETEPDAADLIILTDRRIAAPAQVVGLARNIAFNGAFFGQSPSLAAGLNGALRVREEHSGLGRSPWSSILTIIHRHRGFFVAGRSYSTYDRPTGSSFSCDVDLVTGEWAVSAHRMNPETGAFLDDVSLSGQIAGAEIALSDWSRDNPLPEPCEIALTEWFNAAP